MPCCNGPKAEKTEVKPAEGNGKPLLYLPKKTMQSQNQNMLGGAWSAMFRTEHATQDDDWARRLSGSAEQKAPLVFFDLEATSLIQLGVLPDIIQIGAVGPDCDAFDRYILPEKKMTPSALRVTGLRVEDQTLLRDGKKVPTVSLEDALKGFLDWLRNVKDKAKGRKPLLLAYNSTKFDMPVLKNAFSKAGLTAEAKEVIDGFADVFQMALAKIRKREIGNYKLETLARCYLSTSHDAHNALGDAKALKGVFHARLETDAKQVIKGCADVLKMARDHIPEEEVENYKLEPLTDHFLGKEHGAHEAVADARALRDVFGIRLAAFVDVEDYVKAYD